MYTKIYLFFKNLNNGKPYELPQKLVGNSFQFGQGFPLNQFGEQEESSPIQYFVI